VGLLGGRALAANRRHAPARLVRQTNYDIYRDLVFNKWWTNASGKTNRTGAYSTRGFLGEYDIEVKSGAKTKNRSHHALQRWLRVECCDRLVRPAINHPED